MPTVRFITLHFPFYERDNEMTSEKSTDTTAAKRVCLRSRHDSRPWFFEHKSLIQIPTPSIRRSKEEYWPKLVLQLRTNTQRRTKLVTWLKDQSNYFTWLVLIGMNERIIQQKVNSFCWEKHTSHHFHVGSLVKQNWRPHEVSQLFIFHLRCKFYFINT